MRTLRDELERIRTEHHWTHGRMAAALGIDRSTYRLFVNGRNRAGRKIIGGVARAFPQVNVAYFAAQDVEMAAEALDSSPERDDGPSEYSDTLARRSGAQGAKTEVAQ